MFVEHVGVEEPVPEPDVRVVHLTVVGGHSRQHRPDEGVAEPEGGRCELVEDPGVAGGIVVVGVTLSLNFFILICINFAFYF